MRELVAHRAENALLTVGFLVLCVLEFGALGVLTAERSSGNANIANASDALWWAYVTITTIGYGDRFPVTNSGRIVCIVVMTAGVGLFGALSGFLANQLLAPPKPKAEAGGLDAQDPRAWLAVIRRMIEVQERATAELKAQVEETDRLL